ncbi:MAG: NADH-quinone oxidoreductase subunit N [Candidatus Heimdallarchaeota archaeon]|nr:NADH-quinone oxidoreductase subunit N [Candidatus Heimdallarchaeota archaeon]
MVEFSIAWLPVYVIIVGIIINLVLDLWKREDARFWVASATALTIVATALSVIYVKDAASSALFNYGEFYVFFSLIGLLSSLIVVFVAWKDMSLELDIGVFFSLLLLANVGGMVIAAAQHMVALYVGYELVSLPSYAMAAFRKRDKSGAEAALKFFLLGALSSAILVYGLALYYGATGTFSMGATADPSSESLRLVAIILIASGSGFKIGLVPFHFWIGDVYSGAPSSVVTWLAASSKKMAFAFVMQLFFVGMKGWGTTWGGIFAVLAILSMLLGNIAAVIQTNVMRILAYSTIAQAGYIMIGFAVYGYAGNATAIAAMNGIGVQIIAHVLMKGAAIVSTFVIIDNLGSSELINFKGLFRKNKLVSWSMAIALASLMGIPPLMGFWGKAYLFLSSVSGGMTYLAYVGLVGSAISLYYYMKIINMMIQKPDDEVEIKVTTPIKITLVIMTSLTVLLPIFLERILVVIKAITEEIY